MRSVHNMANVSPREKIEYANNMSIMLKAGISIDETLKLLAQQTDGKRFRRIQERIITRVQSGMSLGDAMHEDKTAFGGVFISLIKAGEASGTLETNLEFLVNWLERDSVLRREIKNATLYPRIVLALMTAVVVGLVGFVLPRILPIFSRLNVELPFTTRLLLKVSEFTTSYWLPTLLAVVGVGIAYKLLSRVDSVRAFLDRLFLKMPVMGIIIREYQLALITHLLGILYKSGITLQESLRITREGISNAVYRNSVHAMEAYIQQGTTLKDALLRFPKLYPKNIISIVAVGERSGTLEKSLNHLSEYYTETVLNRTQKLPSVLEPILLIFVGALVAFVALSIITPIYKITTGIKIR